MGKLRYSFLVLLLFSLLLPQFLFSQASSLHGIDLTDLDRQADPCNDFYEFANGTWRAKNPIPASMDRWSKRWAAGESSKDKLKEILETAATDQNAPQGSNERTIGDYYGACVDQSRVNARGMEPLMPRKTWPNLPDFQKVWSCKADAAMVRPEGKRCEVW